MRRDSTSGILPGTMLQLLIKMSPARRATSASLDQIETLPRLRLMTALQVGMTEQSSCIKMVCVLLLLLHADAAQEPLLRSARHDYG